MNDMVRIIYASLVDFIVIYNILPHHWTGDSKKKRMNITFLS